MRSRLPEGTADQVSSILSGAGEMASTATEAATGAAAAATGKAGDFWNTAKGTVSGLVQNDDQ